RSRVPSCEPSLLRLLLRGRLLRARLLRRPCCCLRLRCSLRLLLRLRGRRACRLLADRLDLDPRERGAEAVVPPVAGALLVLADPDLLATLVAEHLRRHLHALRQQVG